METETQRKIERIVTNGRGFYRSTHKSTNFRGLSSDSLKSLPCQDSLLSYAVGYLDYQDGKLNQLDEKRFIDFCGQIYSASKKYVEDLNEMCQKRYQEMEIRRQMRNHLGILAGLALRGGNKEQGDALLKASRAENSSQFADLLADANHLS